MKNLLFALILLPLVSFSQTADDAISFLQINLTHWLCEEAKLISIGVKGEHKEILYLSQNYNDNQEILLMEIKLADIKSIGIVDNDNEECRGIYIKTAPYGMEGTVISRNGEVVKSAEFVNNAMEFIGWIYDTIGLRVNESTTERSERVVKALKFLAEQAGAELTESHF